MKNMESDHFSSIYTEDGHINLVANKNDHKDLIDEAFLLAVKDVSDTVIVTKDKEELIGNKLVLSVFSPLFRSILHDSVPGSPILLPDCSSSSVRHVLSIITNSFTKIEKESLNDLNDVIETAKVMDIDISNIYVEQSILEGSSWTTESVTPSLDEDQGEIINSSTDHNESTCVSGFVNLPPKDKKDGEKSETIQEVIGSVQDHTLSGLSCFSPLQIIDKKESTCVSGFVNLPPKDKKDGEQSETIQDVIGSVQIHTLSGLSCFSPLQIIDKKESTCVSGFVNLPSKNKEDPILTPNVEQNVTNSCTNSSLWSVLQVTEQKKSSCTSGFVNPQDKDNADETQCEATTGKNSSLLQISDDSDLSWASGFVNPPSKLRLSETIKEERRQDTSLCSSGFNNPLSKEWIGISLTQNNEKSGTLLDPPSNDENFLPELNSTKIDGSVLNPSKNSAVINLPKNATAINPGKWRQKERKDIPNQSGRGIEVKRTKMLGPSSKIIDEDDMGPSLKVQEAGIGGGQEESGISGPICDFAVRTKRRNVLSVGTIIKFLDLSDNESTNQ